MLKLKRAYLPAEEADGYRVLVDRLWPRGKSKDTEKIDLWLKEIAPSADLRKWFNHDSEKYPEFRANYLNELDNGEKKESLEELRAIITRHKTVTLVYGAKNESENNAQVLYELLTENR